MTYCDFVLQKEGVIYGCLSEATTRLTTRVNFGKDLGLGSMYHHRCDAHVDAPVEVWKIERMDQTT